MWAEFFKPENLEAVSKTGLGIAAFVCLIGMVWWILKQQSKILDNAKEERTSWQKLIEAERDKTTQALQGVATILGDHTTTAREFHLQVREAHNYQREEHKDLSEQNGKMCNVLVEAVTILRRINGK
jgi:hypothetical protein